MFNVYICHYTPLINRKKHIINELNKINVNPKNIIFIEEFDKEKLNDNIINNFFNNNEIDWINKTSVFYDPSFRKIKKSEKSLCLKHYSALKKIANGNFEYGLVIEDDCIFTGRSFLKKIKRIIRNMPTNWDVFFPSGHSKYLIDINYFNQKDNKKFNNISNKYIIGRNHPSTVGTYSYIIKKKSAQKIIKEIEKNKISLPMDYEYNWLFYKLNFNVFFPKKKRLIKHSRKKFATTL